MLRSAPCLATALLLAASTTAAANELRIETRSVTPSAATRTLRVDATVRWKNAWRNGRNHDAVWLVVKLRGSPRGEWTHGKLVAIAPGPAGPRATCTVTRDQIGAFCAPAASYRGDLVLQLTINVQPQAVREQDIAAGTVQAMVVGLENGLHPGRPVHDRGSRSAFFRHVFVLPVGCAGESWRDVAHHIGSGDTSRRASGRTLLQGRAIQRRPARSRAGRVSQGHAGVLRHEVRDPAGAVRHVPEHDRRVCSIVPRTDRWARVSRAAWLDSRSRTAATSRAARIVRRTS